MSNRSFQFKESDGYTTLKLEDDLTPDQLKEFETEITKLTQKPAHLLVNCEDLSELPSQWLRVLLLLGKQQKSIKKEVRYMGLNPEILGFIRDQGVTHAFPIATNIKVALIDFGLVTPKAIDVNFINPFLNATLNVLKVQASTEAKGGKPYQKPSNEKFFGDISGVIGLISDAFSGSVVISFPEQTFLKIMSRMMGEEITEMNKEIEDGAGELTNIIFGQAKIELNEKGYGIKTAIPSVISGKDHTIINMTKGPRMVIPFDSDVGSFVVEVCLTD